ncbi:MAG: tRNA preQ1(34) S-adenosylmethionine ribosyltransferase-isomerase QueA [Gammaproteobacteria bacterium]|nr:tRNA preQ1(34) S-adenosylmethionine ribosyltransferase-isomerase QueA [Gammaproteobacteria bacterium]
MNISNFNFSLSEENIAQTPKDKRSDSKLLIIDRSKETLKNEIFKNLDKYISKDDLLVINDTKVIPARIFGYRKNSKGKVEIFIERILNEKLFICQLKSTRKLKRGDIIIIGDKIELRIESNDHILCKVFIQNSSIKNLLNDYGSVPLPPYILRKPKKIDKDYYQTIFAKNDGSVAAPTAGLHFDEEVIKKLKNKGVKITHITLHIGMGTFSSIKTKNIEDHNMHSELYCVPSSTVKLIERCKQNNGKIIAVGTTVARALESFYGSKFKADEFHETNIFIKPGYNFNTVDHLITNFHLPKSSLLIMISAFYNKDKILEAYDFAKKNNYKFFSYGDSTLIL